MPTYLFQDKAVTGSAEIESNFSIKNEWIYFLGIYVKNDGLDLVEIPDLTLERDMTAKVNIESLIELNIMRFWDGDYKLKMLETSGSTNEVTVIVLSITESEMKQLITLGKSPIAFSNLPDYIPIKPS